MLGSISPVGMPWSSTSPGRNPVSGGSGISGLSVLGCCNENQMSKVFSFASRAVRCGRAFSGGSVKSVTNVAGTDECS